MNPNQPRDLRGGRLHPVAGLDLSFTPASAASPKQGLDLSFLRTSFLTPKNPVFLP